MFDPAVAGPLVAFFRTALARDAKERHDTAAEMLAAWRSVFAPVPKTVPDDADECAARAEPATPLAESGLSARALSALEPFGVATVGDLVAVDPVRLNRLSGVAEATRREVKARARQWRDKFGPAITGRGPARDAARRSDGSGRPDPVAAADAAARARGHGPRRVAAGHGPADARARPRPGSVRQPDRAGRRARRVPGPGGPAGRPRCKTAGRITRRAVTCSMPSRRSPGRRSPTWAGSRRWASWPAPFWPHCPRPTPGRMPRRRPGSVRACCAWRWTGRRP